MTAIKTFYRYHLPHLVIYLMVFFSILVACCLPQQALARWAKFEDANLEYESLKSNITVNKDGSFKRISETQIKLLKEPARNLFAKFDLSYNGDSAKFSILSAKTHYQGKTYKVESKNIEDQPLASIGFGFDTLRQVSIAFPNLEIGASIYFKSSYIEKTPAIDNAFAHNYFIGTDNWLKHQCITINSALPLKYLVNDPYKVLDVKVDNKTAAKKITICTKKPFTNGVIDEVGAGTVDPKKLTWVSVSSISDWKEIARYFAPKYNKIINQPLPDLFKAIVKSATAKKQGVEQINAVTVLLSEKLHYLGDWRSIAGRLIPRNLTDIVSTQSGDCKDFSVSLAAILRALGYQADAVLVHRSEQPPIYPYLPDASAFNHAMVKVIDKQDKVYWVDPTNFISMSQILFQDIADRMAFVLDIKNPQYEKIPAIKPTESGLKIDQKIIVTDENKTHYTDTIDFLGQQATQVTGIGLYMSKQSIEDMIYDFFTGYSMNKTHRKNTMLPNLDNRVVSDKRFVIEYEDDHDIFKTNIGAALNLKRNLLKNMANASNENVQDLYIGPPRTYSWTTTIKDKTFDNLSSLKFNIKMPWVSIERKCETMGTDTKITDKIVVSASYIKNIEIKKDSYQAFQQSLKKNYEHVLLVPMN